MRVIGRERQLRQWLKRGNAGDRSDRIVEEKLREPCFWLRNGTCDCEDEGNDFTLEGENDDVAENRESEDENRTLETEDSSEEDDDVEPYMASILGFSKHKWRRRRSC